jgi:lysophospholipase L1-like esterase
MKIGSCRLCAYLSVGLLLALTLVACGGGGGSGSVAATPPTIGGSPATTTVVNATYTFIPTAADVNGDTLTFSIVNPPSWASFDTTTGELTGTASDTDIGVTSGIVISVSDGVTAPVSLAAFDIRVAYGFNEALYADPTVSSSANVRRRYQANDGIDTEPNNGWVVDSGAATPEPWLRLDFDTAKTIYRVTLSDLPGPADQVEALRVEFSNGGLPVNTITLTTALPNDGTPREVPLPAPVLVDAIKVVLLQTRGNAGLAEIAAWSALGENQRTQTEDLFNDGNDNGWSMVDECNSGLPDWGVGVDAIGISPADYTPQAYQQTGDCRSFSTEGVEIGTYSLLFSVPIAPAGMDLRLRLLADDTGNPADWIGGAIGVMFGFVDNDNFYRVDISGREGHRKLVKRKNGVFTELDTSPQSYTLGRWFNLRIVYQNRVILVYLDGKMILAAEDATVDGNKIALFCARNESCNFDNLIILEPPAEPVVGVHLVDGAEHRSGEYFVSADDSLDVAAVVTDDTTLGGVEFVVDAGAPGTQSKTAIAAPYQVQFNFLAADTHTVGAYPLDADMQRLRGSGPEAVLAGVGVDGIHLVGLGDDITAGLKDDNPADDNSADGRNTGGGYQSVLNDLLTAGTSKPVTVLDEGNTGETSFGATRINAVLARTPAARGYLVLYGLNDAIAGVSKAAFKANVQQIITAVRTAGKAIFLAKAPPDLVNGVRDARIVEYNAAIAELINDPANGFVGYAPPDFHTYLADPSNGPDPATVNDLMSADGVHPTGEGYRALAELWCRELRGQLGMPFDMSCS